MKVVTKKFSIQELPTFDLAEMTGIDPSLLFVFGSRNAISSLDRARLRSAFPKAVIAGCSSSGEISDLEVLENSLVISAIQFDNVSLEAYSLDCPAREKSFQVGNQLAAKFTREGLRHVILLSEGLHINGSALVAGLQAGVPEGVYVSGGLAGDGPHFERTEVLFGDEISSRMVCAIGFYGERFRVECSSMGGWDPFGPERRITRCDGNVLYELDDEPALSLYKRYLGDQAKDLPAAGLLFPLSVRVDNDSPAVVRTLLAVDERLQSLTFAGDLPSRGYARFMKANFDRLITGAMQAAENIKLTFRSSPPKFALLISCVGRKLILNQRIEEEIEAIRDVFGDATNLAGFYSYGEISPNGTSRFCELHNQSMTITAFDEL